MIEFKVMLPNINLLFMSCQVLILMDRSYSSRFWTLFEAYLSMRVVTESGLANALDYEGESRTTIVLISNQVVEERIAFEKTWMRKTIDEAYDILAGKDVEVTNKSDKEMQLPKLRLTNEKAKETYLALLNRGQSPQRRSYGISGQAGMPSASTTSAAPDASVASAGSAGFVVSAEARSPENLLAKLSQVGVSQPTSPIAEVSSAAMLSPAPENPIVVEVPSAVVEVSSATGFQVESVPQTEEREPEQKSGVVHAGATADVQVLMKALAAEKERADNAEAALAAEQARADAEKERADATEKEKDVLESRVKQLTTQLAAVGAMDVRRARNEQALTNSRSSRTQVPPATRSTTN